MNQWSSGNETGRGKYKTGYCNYATGTSSKQFILLGKPCYTAALGCRLVVFSF
jgi:hypothetical protein